MKKNRLVLLVAILAAAIGPQIGQAGPPPILGRELGGQPSPEVPLYPTCSDYLYAGYERSAIPGTGQAASVQVNEQSGVVQPGSSLIAAWVGVDDQGSTIHWIQAGITTDNTHGLIKYIEYNPTSGSYAFISKGNASAGTIYGASVTKVAAGSWTASIGASSLGYNVSLSGMNKTRYKAESFTPSDGPCNSMVYYFYNSSPYGTSVMTKIQDSPYVVDSITSNGWHSHGP
jgi:hypothetical protein